MKRYINHPWFFWRILAIPSIAMMLALSQDGDVEHLVHPAGEFAARIATQAIVVLGLPGTTGSASRRTGLINQ